jgi:ATP-dependent Lon protease
LKITSKNISSNLGCSKFRHGRWTKREIGLCIGLAWTEVGGELLNIESSLMKGTGPVVMRAKLGDVNAGVGSGGPDLRSGQAEKFGLEENFYKRCRDVHIHVPGGRFLRTVSAGIAMATSIASAFIRRKIRGDLAIDREITLRGRDSADRRGEGEVLAAHRGNLKTVKIPKDNEKDLRKVPSPTY